MKYPNLAWAAAQRRLAHYQLALDAGMSESKFSRGLNGRNEFSAEERVEIAEVLGYPEKFLFKEVSPPPAGPDTAKPAAASASGTQS